MGLGVRDAILRMEKRGGRRVRVWLLGGRWRRGGLRMLHGFRQEEMVGNAVVVVVVVDGVVWVRICLLSLENWMRWRDRLRGWSD